MVVALSLACFVLEPSVQVLTHGLAVVDVDPGFLAGQEVVQGGAGLALGGKPQRRIVWRWPSVVGRSTAKAQRPWRRLASSGQRAPSWLPVVSRQVHRR
jgi:hypothetical protein